MILYLKNESAEKERIPEYFVVTFTNKDDLEYQIFTEERFGDKETRLPMKEYYNENYNENYKDNYEKRKESGKEYLLEQLKYD